MFCFLTLTAIPTDVKVCEWISTVYDVIQRQKDSDVNFNVESAKLGITPDLLKFCVNRDKPPTITARKLFQNMCMEELSKGTSRSEMPINKIDAIHGV